MELDNFSVLMSVYAAESGSNLKMSLQSVLDQTLKPKEFILVEDGPLTDELYSVIQWFEDFASFDVIKIKNEKNLGLGPSLNKGISAISTPYIIRCDSDDINIPVRFEKQIQFMLSNDLDLSSTPVKEFDCGIDEIIGIKSIPEDEESIIKMSKYRNPINHMSACYKKASIIKAGMYEDIPYFEDYFLWLKMINLNMKIRNYVMPLVYARRDRGFYLRRSGIQYVKKELYFQKERYNYGMINFGEYIWISLVRILPRLASKKVLKKIYSYLRE